MSNNISFLEFKLKYQQRKKTHCSYTLQWWVMSHLSWWDIRWDPLQHADRPTLPIHWTDHWNTLTGQRLAPVFTVHTPVLLQYISKIMHTKRRFYGVTGGDQISVWCVCASLYVMSALAIPSRMQTPHHTSLLMCSSRLYRAVCSRTVTTTGNQTGLKTQS